MTDDLRRSIHGLQALLSEALAVLDSSGIDNIGGLKDRMRAAALPFCQEPEQELVSELRTVEQLSEEPGQEPILVASAQALDVCRRLNSALEGIGNFAHDKSTGPTVPDALWEVRSMAFDAMEAFDSAAGLVAVPAKRKTAPWYASARVADFDQGWNECVDAILANLAAQPGENLTAFKR
jgi:hypothetical protein